jgi:hypothetical protein
MRKLTQKRQIGIAKTERLGEAKPVDVPNAQPLCAFPCPSTSRYEDRANVIFAFENVVVHVDLAEDA